MSLIICFNMLKNKFKKNRKEKMKINNVQVYCYDLYLLQKKAST